MEAGQCSCPKERGWWLRFGVELENSEHIQIYFQGGVNIRVCKLHECKNVYVLLISLSLVPGRMTST